MIGAFVAWGFCRLGFLSSGAFVVWGFCRLELLSPGLLSLGLLSLGLLSPPPSKPLVPYIDRVITALVEVPLELPAGNWTGVVVCGLEIRKRDQEAKL